MHALDTERRTAVCIDLDLSNLRGAALEIHGGRLDVVGDSGLLARIDTATHRVIAAPGKRAARAKDRGLAGTPWLPIAAPTAALLLLATHGGATDAGGVRPATDRTQTRPHGPWNNRWMITKLDFVAVPSQDWERARQFYGETLGLRPDEHAPTDFWVGETCLGICEPERFGMEFAPQKNAHLALHVDDVAATRAELEAKGVSFAGDILDTGVCHMAFFTDPDGNDLMLHHRYAPYE